MAERAVDVLLAGGGVASVRCARALRRHGFDGSILVVGDERALPYNRPPLSKELLRDELPDDLVAAESAGWYERREIELLTGVEVIELEARRRRAVLGDGQRVQFERCLLAIGAAPRTLRVPGGERALLLRTLPDARRLRAAAMAAGHGAPAVIVGGGFIGVEVASALAAMGLRPIIVELLGELWAGTLGSSLGAWARGRLEGIGVDVRVGAAVTRVEPGAAWIGDERLEAAFVVAGIGVVPRVALASAAGLDVHDGIVTDGEQRTGNPAIWAAGDVARSDGSRVEHWHAAREGGERAARSMLGLPNPPRPVPWVFSEVGGTPIDVVGTASDWSREKWIGGGSVLAYLLEERVVQLAVIDSALPPAEARRLVETRASAAGVEAAIGAAEPMAGG